MSSPVRLQLDSNILLANVRMGVLGQYIEKTYSLSTLRPEPIISIVTEGEIRDLALRNGWGPQRCSALDALLNTLTIVPLPFLNVVDAYAKIVTHCGKNGLALSQNDLW